ncbi:amidase [Acidobacteria bacterium Mor1]|nr:amidase [Acidobacteria bacterium Mor1]
MVCLRFGASILVLLLAVGLGCAPPTGDASPAGEGPSEDYRPEGWPARTLPEIAEALRAGEVSSEQVVQAYLDRIERIDRSGPELRSVLALNPRALEDARAADAAREAGEELGLLHGVPVLLKDNIESADPVATTAGALALEANVTERDSPLVAGLREAGAIILGKTNLSQWANFRSRDSMSGWSALGGQVRNPHMTDRNPCGSSSGSGAAVAASLGSGAVGTETNGSIICPSTVNGIVGFKPTVGLVSQQYIVPISSSQDTAGPMTKTVRGTAMMLTAMATGEGKTDYVAALDENALAGKRVGVLRFATGSNADTIALFDSAVAAMEEAGATLVEIEDFDAGVDNWGGKSAMLMETEFKATLDAYLADAAAAVEVRSLEELIAFNERHADVELALFDQSLFELSVERKGLDDPEYVAARDEVQRAVRQDGIDRLLAEHEVDVLVSPSGPVAPRIDPVNGDVWPSWAGAGWMAAVAGYPHLSVPMGDVHGLPVGVSFMAGAGDDAAVIAVGYAYEQRTGHRVEPGYLPGAEARTEIGDAMRGTVER